MPASTIRFTHTFGLGGMSLVLVLLLMGTGVLLMFVYEPSAEGAHGSIAAFSGDVLFGPLVRGVHYWCANLSVVVVIAALVPLPYFRYRDRLDGKWFLSDLGRRTAVVALGAGDSEAEQALFVLLLIVFVVFTLTGVWFRGTGMALA